MKTKTATPPSPARALALALPLALAGLLAATNPPPARAAHGPDHPAAKGHKLDTSGCTRRGKASYYGREFFGRTMADGTPMKPQGRNAASKTLPIGTEARVTNLENGRSAVVRIRDRGPYVDGRIVDLSPATAKQLDMVEDGVAPVEVEPLSVPLPDGSVKTAQGDLAQCTPQG